MCDGDVELRGCQRASQSRVGVPIDQHPVRLFFEKNLLHRLQHAAGHGAVLSAGYLQVVFRVGDIQLVEEHLGHVFIVVLAGMNQDFNDPVGEFVAYAPGNGCRLDELGPRTNNGNDLDQLPSASTTALTI